MDRRRFMGGVAGGFVVAQQSVTSMLEAGADAAIAGAAPPASPPTVSAGASPRVAPLADLAPNTARNIGSWIEPATERDSANGAPGQRTDYSGVAYDPVGNRILMRGGHHGINLTTNIRAMDLNPIRFYNLMPNVLLEEMTLANCDASKGRWLVRGQNGIVLKDAPWSRHTYGGNVFMVHPQLGPRLYVMAEQNSHQPVKGVTFPSASPSGCSVWYDFATQRWGYSRMRGNSWLMNLSAVATLVGHKILLVVSGQDSWLRAYLYDPVNDAQTRLPVRFDETGWRSEPSLVAYPPNGKYYAIKTDGKVFEISLDVTKPSESEVTQVASAGWPDTEPSTPHRFTRFDYDPINKVIGGSLVNGTYMAFKPTVGWKKYSPTIEAGSPGVPNTSFHCAVFEPSGCYIAFDANGACWAYRPPSFGGASTGNSASSSRDLSVTLDFGGGKVAKFSGGIDMGDFVGEFVRQRCFLATDPAFPDWRVMFRPDVDGKRDEVVVEYGRSAGATPVNRLEPYTAKIMRGSAVVATETVPIHGWYQRWRWQSTPRPVFRTPAMLKQRHWLPNFGPAAVWGRRESTIRRPWTGPMCAMPGFQVVMGTAGDNDQIGFVTESAAEYAFFGSDRALEAVRAEGEWCGNWPIHARALDGSMHDLRKDKITRGNGANQILKEVRINDPRYMLCEFAHWFACANMAWMLTDDPYYLEELQFGVQWRQLWSSSTRINTQLWGLISGFEPRAFAWAIRDVSLLASSTPAAVPKWLLPRSAWKSCLDDHLSYSNWFVRSPTRLCTLFRAWTRADMVASWMNAWLTTAVGFAVKMGFEEWRPVFDWSVGMQVAMTNGTSGWDRRVCAPYYYYPLKQRDFGLSGWPKTSTPALDAATHATWKDASDAYLAEVARRIDITKWDDHSLQSSEYYLLHLRTALVTAIRHGTPGAQACYDYLQTEMQASAYRGKQFGQFRFAIDP